MFKKIITFINSHDNTVLWGVNMAEGKIIFLGTGGDVIVVGKHIRSAGGIIIQSDENQIHIDPGPGSLAKAREYDVDLRDNTAVLVSHNHLNHCNDVNAVISAMTLNGIDAKGVVIGHRGLFENIEGTKQYVTDFHKKCVERCINLDVGQKIGVNDLEIVSTAAMHNETTAMGFKVFTPHFVLGYTGDTQYTDSLAHDFKNVDVLIVNVQNPGDQRKDFLLCTEDAVKLIEQAMPKLAIITHFGIKMIQGDVLTEAREIQRRTKVQTLAAKDGMVVNPQSYSVNLRQKTLNL